jgi:hypothetical protein
MRWIVSCSVLAVLGLAGLLAFPNLHSQEITSAPPSLSLGLTNIADYKNFTAHRASSADPTGENNDKRFIPPGQTLALAEIQGRKRFAERGNAHWRFFWQRTRPSG